MLRGFLIVAALLCVAGTAPAQHCRPAPGYATYAPPVYAAPVYQAPAYYPPAYYVPVAVIALPGAPTTELKVYGPATFYVFPPPPAAAPPPAAEKK